MIFENVIAFKWQQAINTQIANEQSDCCYLVENSRWLAQHIKQEKIADKNKYNHYKFCFSVAGILEVIANNMRTEIQIV